MICARITSSLLMTSQTGMGSQLLCLSVPTDPRNAVLGGAIHKRGCSLLVMTAAHLTELSSLAVMRCAVGACVATQLTVPSWWPSTPCSTRFTRS